MSDMWQGKTTDHFFEGKFNQGPFSGNLYSGVC